MTGEAVTSDRVPYAPGLVKEYTGFGYWKAESLTDYVRENARRWPQRAAYVSPETRLTWTEYETLSSRIAIGLIRLGLRPGERIAVQLPDRPITHVLYVALEKAGAVLVGVGIRSGERELERILHVTGASTLITPATYREADYGALFERLRGRLPLLRRHMVLANDENEARERVTVDALIRENPVDDAGAALIEQRRLGPNDLFMINSTSGTTGVPKCVMHTQNRWCPFTRWAIDAADLTSDDVFMSLVPAPFGFGLWTAHVTPTQLGVPTVIVERPSPGLVLEMLQRERVTVLACVSTSFIQLLNEPTMDRFDLSTLKAMFTGGEAVPYQRSLEFERRTGAAVLQFYGSNESGALSYTTLADTQERRLKSAGRVIPEMHVRLFDTEGHEVPDAPVRVGQPGCKGPSICPGYLDDPAANQKLFTSDGWLMVGDVVRVDEDGYLSVVGRVADIIIRGGANISAVKVEEEILAHPAVAYAAVVGMPDPVLGERVCAYVVPRADRAITLTELVTFMEERGNSKYLLPERLVVVAELPISTGGKVHKSELRADIERRLVSESGQT
jgi:acyl-CoA synthetase